MDWVICAIVAKSQSILDIANAKCSYAKIWRIPSEHID